MQKNKRWSQSVELSKKDRLYKDALQTAAESRDQAVAEDLLKFFVDNTNHSAFAATLYTCYDLIRPDVALELAWRNKIIDFAFPYIIQYVRDLTGRVDALEKAGKPTPEEEKKKKDTPEGFQVPPNPNDMGMGVGIDGLPIGYGAGYGYAAGPSALAGAPLALMPPPGSMPGFGGYANPTDYGAYGAQPQYDPSQQFGYGGFQ